MRRGEELREETFMLGDLGDLGDLGESIVFTKIGEEVVIREEAEEKFEGGALLVLTWSSSKGWWMWICLLDLGWDWLTEGRAFCLLLEEKMDPKFMFERPKSRSCFLVGRELVGRRRMGSSLEEEVEKPLGVGGERGGCSGGEWVGKGNSGSEQSFSIASKISFLLLSASVSCGCPFSCGCGWVRGGRSFIFS